MVSARFSGVLGLENAPSKVLYMWSVENGHSGKEGISVGVFRVSRSSISASLGDSFSSSELLYMFSGGTGQSGRSDSSTGLFSTLSIFYFTLSR